MYEAGVGFVRMPQKIAASVSEGVRFLSTNGAGLRLNFTTNSKTLRLYVRESCFCRMQHMALTGSTGFVLCSREGEEKKTVFRGCFAPNGTLATILKLPLISTASFAITFCIFLCIRASNLLKSSLTTTLISVRG